MEKIDEIVATLPELFRANRKDKGDTRFTQAIFDIAQLLSKDRLIQAKGDYWNPTIDYLDKHYDRWRGYKNPEYEEIEL